MFANQSKPHLPILTGMILPHAPEFSTCPSEGPRPSLSCHPPTSPRRAPPARSRCPRCPRRSHACLRCQNPMRSWRRSVGFGARPPRRGGRRCVGGSPPAFRRRTGEGVRTSRLRIWRCESPRCPVGKVAEEGVDHRSAAPGFKQSGQKCQGLHWS